MFKMDRKDADTRGVAAQAVKPPPEPPKIEVARDPVERRLLYTLQDSMWHEANGEIRTAPQYSQVSVPGAIAVVARPRKWRESERNGMETVAQLHRHLCRDSPLRVDTRWAAGDADEIRRHAAELATTAPDVILAHGASTVRPLMQATRNHRSYSRLSLIRWAEVSSTVYRGPAATPRDS
jgi:hypothetical protein